MSQKSNFEVIFELKGYILAMQGFWLDFLNLTKNSLNYNSTRKLTGIYCILTPEMKFLHKISLLKCLICLTRLFNRLFSGFLQRSCPKSAWEISNRLHYFCYISVKKYFFEISFKNPISH